MPAATTASNIIQFVIPHNYISCFRLRL